MRHQNGSLASTRLEALEWYEEIRRERRSFGVNLDWHIDLCQFMVNWAPTLHYGEVTSLLQVNMEFGIWNDSSPHFPSLTAFLSLELRSSRSRPEVPFESSTVAGSAPDAGPISRDASPECSAPDPP
jgi:hypothetical protein